MKLEMKVSTEQLKELAPIAENFWADVKNQLLREERGMTARKYGIDDAIQVIRDISIWADKALAEAHEEARNEN